MTRFFALSATPASATFQGLYNGCATSSYNYVIGAFTSADAGSTFTRYASNPVIGTGAGWRSIYIKDPSIVWDGTQYVCYAAGWDGSNHQVGRFTSPDGFTWTAYGSNPIFGVPNDGGWRENGALFPYLTFDAGRTPKWRIWLTGSHGITPDYTIGMLDGSDGISWTDHGKVLDLGAAASPDEFGLEMGCVLETGATSGYIYYGGIPASNLYKGCYATFTDPTNSATYTKGGILTGYSGNITIDGHVYRSNQPRGILPFGVGYKMLWDCWNASGSPLEQCFQVVGTDPVTFPSPPSVSLFPRTGGWDDNSAENPTVIQAP